MHPSAAIPLSPSAGAEPAAHVERRFRKGLVAASLLTGLALSAYLGTVLWSQNEFSPPESVVAAHSYMLVHDGTLYYDLNRYPYTVSAYTPLFYLLEAGLIRLGLPAFTAGRLISFAALLGLALLCGKLARLYTNSPYAAWCARLFAASSPLLLNWGSIAQVDTLACFFSAAAFYQYSRLHVLGERRLAAALAFAVLAAFTKQTAVAAPVAICLMLWTRSWRASAAFGAVWIGAMAAVALAINAALRGRFLSDTVFANLNPMSIHKLSAHLIQLGSVSGGLLVLVAAGAGKLMRGRGLAPLVYLTVASAVFLATAPKIGSDTNYQVEMTTLLAVCAAVALAEVGFFRLYFTQSKSWVTLLLLPAAVHLAVGYRSTVNTVLFRVFLEKAHRAQIEALRPFVEPAGGRVLSSDYNSMVRLRQRMDIEPLIYTLLVSAGVVDPEPVRRDLERGAFSTVVIGRNLFDGTDEGPADLELGSLPAGQLEAIRHHYRLAARIDTPGFDGGYVYKPALAGATE